MKRYLHYIIKWRFKNTETVLIGHHIASCGEGKQDEHIRLIKDTYRQVYDSGITYLISIDCTEVSEGEYTLLRQKYMEVI
ncbi:hypothetical protein BTGOE5_12960 [Bacillus thuringiensis]|uniref:Uncharacterized protein n=1 Tax=Bacillus toyonensis TaxID=155322 RepID=A0AB36T559_9BACI|nr:hypothetical protein BTGOE5_12960 [Bacillus thuringiensis]OFD09359.1 hypothetical protein BTGOE7_13290 [Bacillus thuringiensis]PEC09602.1 hypothetical protein CON55_18110 [Bacillus toyonensis]PEL42005.1 hypothetical protein CN607_11175 [Bacillus wiedmannii]PEN88697.1 hypothetical protein CN551_13130 [Bacillus toyonensis]